MILLNGSEVKFNKFPNGETMFKSDMIKDIDVSSEQENLIYFKYEDDSDFVKLMFLKKYLDHITDVGISLIISYMPYSRMDRSEDLSPFTLKYIGDFINYLDFNAVIIVEPHSDVTPAVIDNSAPYFINFDLLEYVVDATGFDREKDYLFFPDAGAQKRYANLKGYNQLVGYKHRNFETGEIEKLEVVGAKDNVKGKKVIIVDDLSSYGGTFYFSGKQLRKIGFTDVSLLVAHAEDSIFNGKLFGEDSPVDRIFTTSSHIKNNGIWINKQYDERLTVLKLEELLNLTLEEN